ncbi:hypothetical protein [Nocardia sp. Root136]|uniref:hypothetical protein n=1 Tax=Nocardia sp. Root136 TaxID=1736458 RepID=UPI000B32A9F9|nr:hypothetical protein [Nocardia sp. Root136]
MNSRIIRSLTVTAFALSASALGAGTAAAATTAAPVSGSAEVCFDIPSGSAGVFKFCL